MKIMIFNCRTPQIRSWKIKNLSNVLRLIEKLLYRTETAFYVSMFSFSRDLNRMQCHCQNHIRRHKHIISLSLCHRIIISPIHRINHSRNHRTNHRTNHRSHSHNQPATHTHRVMVKVLKDITQFHKVQSFHSRPVWAIPVSECSYYENLCINGDFEGVKRKKRKIFNNLIARCLTCSVVVWMFAWVYRVKHFKPFQLFHFIHYRRMKPFMNRFTYFTHEMSKPVLHRYGSLMNIYLIVATRLKYVRDFLCVSIAYHLNFSLNLLSFIRNTKTNKIKLIRCNWKFKWPKRHWMCVKCTSIKIKYER